jgi:hypothetical protein
MLRSAAKAGPVWMHLHTPLKSLRENDHHPIESRRDSWKVLEPWTRIRAEDRESWEGSACDSIRLRFSRPYGTFRLSYLYPGLRPGLSSAVPAGLDGMMVVLMQTLKPYPSGFSFWGRSFFGDLSSGSRERDRLMGFARRFSAQVSGFPARGASNICACGFH